MKKNFLRSTLFLLGMLFLNLASGMNYNCVVVVSKNPQWSQYDVNISLHDFLTQRPIMTFHLPKASAKSQSLNMASAHFDCSQYQEIQFYATFSPPIWQNQANKVYSSTIVWNITQQLAALKNGQNQLQIQVKFPEQFANVPELINTNLFK